MTAHHATADADFRVVTVGIAASRDVVYAYARQMQNLPNWASGLAAGVREQHGVWTTESPMGTVQVAMAPENPYGVLDHDVTLPNGTTVHNALRVTPTGPSSCAVSFVVLRTPGAPATALDQDAEHVRKDLTALKKLMER